MMNVQTMDSVTRQLDAAVLSLSAAKRAQWAGAGIAVLEAEVQRLTTTAYQMRMLAMTPASMPKK